MLKSGKQERDYRTTRQRDQKAEQNTGFKKNRPALRNRPGVWKSAELQNSQAARLLRRMRSVLAPNGSSSNAPAIMVVGSGTGAAASKS